jgi:DNA polymerase I-like protein with 3'-5' exonuclease and polymerase domains
MDIITIDFETYYDKEFSLSKMTTEQYIRDPRFELIGVGVKINHYPTDWYSGENFGGFLKGLDWKSSASLSHNTMFDGAIMGWRLGIKPKLWLDTLSMARPLHAMEVSLSLKALCNYYGLGAKGDEVVNALGKRKAAFSGPELARYGDYCINDVELTYKLFKKLVKRISPEELKVIDATLRMYIEPKIELDATLLHAHLDDVIEKKNQLLYKLDSAGIGKAELMSNQQLANLLIKLGVEPPTKVSKTTGGDTYAFSKSDKEFLELQNHPSPLIQAIVSARLGVKSTLEETRTQALLGVAERGRLPIALNYYGAHTGRFSGGEKLNLQNLPRKGMLRKAMRAPKGHVVVTCDSSQIEARTLAWLAGQNDLVDAFKAKRDVYSEFASELYDRRISKEDKEERFVGKVCVLGLGYGLGAERLQETLASGSMGMKVNVSLHTAQRMVSIYRTKNYKITGLWDKSKTMLSNMVMGRGGMLCPVLTYDEKALNLPNGMQLRYPMLQHKNHSFRYMADPKAYLKLTAKRMAGEPLDDDDLPWTYIYGGKVVENFTQAVARIIITGQLLELEKRYPVVLQVHDELVFLAPEEEKDQAVAFVTSIMSTPPKWAPDLPVACEAGVGPTYGDAK